MRPYHPNGVRHSPRGFLYMRYWAAEYPSLITTHFPFHLLPHKATRRIISQLWPRQYLILSLNPFCTDVVIRISSAVTRNIPRQFLSTLYLLAGKVHNSIRSLAANLTEFMLVRVITFVGMPENLVGDRSSIFLPIYGRPRVTIRG